MSDLSNITVDNNTYNLKDASIRNSIAQAFSSSATYAVGDYCIYNGTLYKCTTASIGDWDGSNWTTVKVMNEINNGSIEIVGRFEYDETTGDILGEYFNLYEDTTAGGETISRNTATGFYAHAEGASTLASGDASHAEGANTTASGDISHAEGGDTIASGGYSHAEGSRTQALGNSSHAEGSSTEAVGTYSHAEGEESEANGNRSHAEGYYTEANGNYSHAQNERTIANGQSQTTIGKYNIADPATATPGVSGTYAFIIGNGSGAVRSNAFAVRWNGTIDVADQTSGTGTIAIDNGTLKVNGTAVGGSSYDDTELRGYITDLQDSLGESTDAAATNDTAWAYINNLASRMGTVESYLNDFEARQF